MIGLRGARVIVVDDEAEEALPIVEAMSRAGVASAFFQGKEEDIPSPEQRLEGVRLAILDMDIVGGGVSDRSKAASLAGFLERMLSPRNGPYAVIAWTKHPEIRDAFEEAVFRSRELPKPIFIEMIEKREYRLEGGGFNLAGLADRLMATLQANRPLLFFQAWEEAAAHAAADVTTQLSGLAIPNDGDPGRWRNAWRGNLLCLMHAIARASAERQLDAENCVEAICNVLNPLHADQMEQRSDAITEAVRDLGPEVLAAPPDCGDERRARVNSMLHLASGRGNRLGAGVLYGCTREALAQLGINAGSLVDDLVRRSVDGTRDDQWRQEVEGVARLILVEVNATCDHAQKNIRTGRFVAGLVVPVTSDNRMKNRGQFFWRFGPVFLCRPSFDDGLYMVYLSSRHAASVELSAGESVDRIGLVAIARFRGQAFAVLQTWLAGHLSRPGMLFLTPPE